MSYLNLIGEVDEKMVEKVAEHLQEVKGEHVNIRLCSEGGSSYDALAIADMLIAHTGTVKVTVFGKCMSAAIMIVAVADLRVAAPNAWFMVHEEAADGVTGSTTALERHAQQLREEENTWNKLLSNYTATDLATWDHMSRETTYFNAKTAQLFGLVDSILDAE